MKVAITTTGNSPDAPLDPRFGRASRFLIADTETQKFEVVENTQNLNAAQGAGIQAALKVAETGVSAVLTGHCGPKAFRVLSEAGIKVFNTNAKTAGEALSLYMEGKLSAAESADVEGHWV